MMNDKVTENTKKAMPATKRPATRELGKINLSVPPFRQGSKKKKLGDTIPIKRWHALNSNPDALIKEVASFMRSTNREKADTLDRIYVAETALQNVSRGIRNIYNAYLTQEVFPESEEQKETLNFAIDAVHQVGIAYKHIFKAEYESFNSPMKLINDRVRHAGFRIIELIQIEQRLLAASYQKLPETAWKDLNQVFFVYWYFNDYNTARELSGSLNMKKQKNKISFTGEQPKSPLQLYISIQLFGLAEGNSIPNKALHIVDAYLSLIEYNVTISEHNEEEQTDGWLIISKNQTFPPQFKPHNIVQPAIQIDLFDLWRQVKKDSDALDKINKGLAENISPALATVEEAERIPLVNNLLTKLRHYSRKSTRKNSASSVSLKVFIGLPESHKAIACSSSTDQEACLGLSDNLSLSSAGITSSFQMSINEKWYLVDESDSGLRIQTQTSNNTTKISVGKILSYKKFNAEIPNLTLGYITRINRINDVDIEISIVKLSDKAQSIIAQDERRNGKEAAVIGFLIIKDDKTKQIVLPNSWRALQEQHLNLVYQNQKQEIKIKSPTLQQREFTIFNIKYT